MLNANDRQVGGKHYKSNYQHWDWVANVALPYLPAAATKYLVRWRKKNGLQDVAKTFHYIEKLLEEHELRRAKLMSETILFLSSNEVRDEEKEIIQSLISYEIGDATHLRNAISVLGRLHKIAEKEDLECKITPTG